MIGAEEEIQEEMKVMNMRIRVISTFRNEGRREIRLLVRGELLLKVPDEMSTSGTWDT